MKGEHLYTADELAIYEHIDCGAVGHAWDLIPGLGRRTREPNFGEQITLRCIKCQSERYIIVQRESRERLASWYDYSPGYRFAKGERPSRLDFLLMATDERKRKRSVSAQPVSKSVPRTPGRSRGHPQQP